jgi:malto-oligosyltrehalose trehalohydrolase/4-alpha-glucanotransferase
MPFGAEARDDGTVRFRLWAPSHVVIQIELDHHAEPLAMRAIGGGWHELITDRAPPGTRYGFVLPDGLRVPDPASRHQARDVHGPSEVIDPATHAWSDGDWRGRPWEEAVVYELHIGAFTPEGTFRAAIGKLDHLVALGVTALEIMPIGDFPGARNWGYDGVLPFAPDASYGRPDDLKALVEAAHARGLMVLLDVVYNHFGPEGAYLHAIARETFTDRHKTPWGAAIDMDGPDSGPVRDYFIHNALYWIEEFNLDGLRLDAVHAILDESRKHFLEELAERVRAATPDRHIHLILENEENAAHRLQRREGGPEGLTLGDSMPRSFTAQWNDDVHHVLHVAASGDGQGYYADYLGDTHKLARALAEGFAFQGEMMPYRGRARGEPSGSLPPTAFVAFIQNHDQVGNRPFGDRLTAFASPEAVRAVACVYLLLPQVPMLFMGEEWGAEQPFPFFCDFGPDLAEAVRNGRRAEFARFPEFHDPRTRERIPDPTAEETFAAAKLAWDDVLRAPHAGWLDWYCRVLATRHAAIIPRLPEIRRGGRYDVIGDGAVVVRWPIGEAGTELQLAANLSGEPVLGFPAEAGRVLWREGGAAGEDGRLGPWSVRWSILDPNEVAIGRGGALDQLADRMGIEPEFRDVRGKTVRTSDETKRALLAAMGHAAGDEAQAAAASQALERAEWLSPLPPVMVVRADVSPEVDLVLPAGTISEVNWHLALDGGGHRTGHVPFGQLEWIAARDIDDQRLERRRLRLQGTLPPGYHTLTVEPGGAAMSLIVTPGRCWLPDSVRDSGRLWGIAAQLYLLRSDNNWGIGDFGDLRDLVELAASRGAAVIGLNPLHAMFLDNPGHASPYSPASRLLLNILNIDVTALPELHDSPDVRKRLASRPFREQIEACRAAHLVDYPAVARLKLTVLEKLFDACRSASDLSRWRACAAFRQERGAVLEQTCLFLALREHFAAVDPARADWHHWPEEYRDPASPAVAEFRRVHQHRVDFLTWTQWLADEQLRAAARLAAERGMAVGLYRDLAIGADRSGAETWANAAAVISGAGVGAPPDIGNPVGQDWGLPPFHPLVLRQQAYRGFIDLIRANMRHAGGLRIDHVMGLQHLYWVPAGQPPSEGAYVRYPMEDLLGILALESQRHHCLVVGEDLGTVPEGFRERMAAANILSYRVLFFEQDATTGDYSPPGNYPRLALAVVGSHDLPTLHGWWQGRDLDLKADLKLFPRRECGIARICWGHSAANGCRPTAGPSRAPCMLTSRVPPACWRWCKSTI